MRMPTSTGTRLALVTGASSGIGAETARELARRGYELALVGRREEALRALAAELGGATVFSTDLADVEARETLLGRVGELPVDLLVNAAGLGSVAPVCHVQRARELETVRVNIEALIDLTTLLVPAMVARGTGAVLHVASTAAFMPVPGQATYAASKAFVLSYAHTVRAELRGTGVACSVLCPGPVRTEFASSAGVDDELLFHGLPESMILTAAQVARAGVDGLLRDQAVIVPGAVNRAMAMATAHMPRRLLLPLLVNQSPGMLRHSTAAGSAIDG